VPSTTVDARDFPHASQWSSPPRSHSLPPWPCWAMPRRPWCGPLPPPMTRRFGPSRPRGAPGGCWLIVALALSTLCAVCRRRGVSGSSGPKPGCLRRSSRRCAKTANGGARGATSHARLSTPSCLNVNGSSAGCGGRSTAPPGPAADEQLAPSHQALRLFPAQPATQTVPPRGDLAG
jgi:hypothetical protein